jgi:hypothetical protein
LPLHDGIAFITDGHALGAFTGHEPMPSQLCAVTYIALEQLALTHACDAGGYWQAIGDDGFDGSQTPPQLFIALPLHGERAPPFACGAPLTGKQVPSCDRSASHAWH